MTSFVLFNVTSELWNDTGVSNPWPLYNDSGGYQLCPVITSEGEDESYYHFYKVAQLVTGLFIYPAVCFPGVIGNSLTIFVLSRRNMRTSTNAFLSALAVSDTIKLINDILYFFVILFMRTSPVLGNLSYGYLYPYAHFVFSMSVCVSSWLTVSVAVERYILVCHPTRAREIWSRKYAVILCTVIYVIMTSLALPSAFRYRTIRCYDTSINSSRLEVELTEMWQNKVFVTTYTWIQNLLRSIIPLLVLIVLNACIISSLRKTRGRRRRNSRHRVTVMMIVVILAFLICITPDAVLSTIFGEGYHEAGYLTKGIREITDTLLAINAAVNFLIYCGFNPVFRKSFARICCPVYRQTSSWMTEVEESTYRRLSEAKLTNASLVNGSPRRQDTPPTIISETSTAAPSPLAPSGSVKHRDSNTSSEQSAFQKSRMDQTYGSTTDPSAHDAGNQRTNAHNRSSHRLRRCRNSVKSKRSKTRHGSASSVDTNESGRGFDTEVIYDEEEEDDEEERLPSPRLKVANSIEMEVFKSNCTSKNDCTIKSCNGAVLRKSQSSEETHNAGNSEPAEIKAAKCNGINSHDKVNLNSVTHPNSAYLRKDALKTKSDSECLKSNGSNFAKRYRSSLRQKSSSYSPPSTPKSVCFDSRPTDKGSESEVITGSKPVLVTDIDVAMSLIKARDVRSNRVHSQPQIYYQTSNDVTDSSKAQDNEQYSNSDNFVTTRFVGEILTTDL